MITYVMFRVSEIDFFASIFHSNLIKKPLRKLSGFISFYYFRFSVFRIAHLSVFIVLITCPNVMLFIVLLG